MVYFYIFLFGHCKKIFVQFAYSYIYMLIYLCYIGLLLLPHFFYETFLARKVISYDLFVSFKNFILLFFKKCVYCDVSVNYVISTK